jgi:alpha-mannosidase
MQDKEFDFQLERGKKLFIRMEEQLLDRQREFRAVMARTADPVKFSDRLKLAYRPIGENELWGEAWDSAWFCLEGEIPPAWSGRTVAVRINLSGEALLFDAHGVPRVGFSAGTVFELNFSKEFFRILEPAAGGEKLELWIEAAANHLFGIDKDTDPPTHCPAPDGSYQPKVRSIRYGVFNEEVRQLRAELEVLLSLATVLGRSDYRSARIVRAIGRAVDAYSGDPEHAAAARGELRPVLTLPAMASAPTATAVGHGHLDIGWLWPVRENIRKCARTFSSQLRLLERFPDYVFGASQPQLYAWTREHYPELYAEIRRYVAGGRWELQGGMWVEADCNIISGESMVRQFLHGKNFFMDEFGIDVKGLWLPDVFGYSAALPQIIRRAGCDFFLTQKMSWNQFNRFPHHTFFWRGIDGSRVLSHFPPEDSYNAALLPHQMVAAQNRFRENDLMDQYLSVFGVGDGGGGPKEEHLDRGDLLRNLEGNPKVRFGRADEFFAAVAERFADALPEWTGELYLEIHRGTLTSQSRVKRGNRKLEQMLTAVEVLCSGLPGCAYPAAELDGLWKMLLTNQFHDILPGSAIGSVYETVERQYRDGLAQCERLIATAAVKAFAADPECLIVVNTLSYAFDAPIELPASWQSFEVSAADGRTVATQHDTDGSWVLTTIPALGSVELRRCAVAGPSIPSGSADEFILENDLIRYTFNLEGRLISAFDHVLRREMLQGKANLLSIYHDHPNEYDAWEIDPSYETGLLEELRADSIVRIADGPVYSELAIRFSTGESLISQRVRLARHSRRLDFATEVDWQESHRMLRVAFPAAVAANEASFDIQYGYAKRSTSCNTSWDMARFEAVGQRYVDVSQRSFGVALLNDCKYGHKVRGATLDLCLLRSPKYPDWNADQGAQRFTYSLLPHTGDLVNSDVMRQAAMLNRSPLLLVGFSGTFTPPCRIESETVTLEVCKKAEKTDAWVIRLVENSGDGGIAELILNSLLTPVETNLVEWSNEGKIPVRDNRATLHLGPFEIKTIQLKKR